MRKKEEPQVAQFDIGDFLKNRRQQRQESVLEVSSQIKLPVKTIELIESNKFSEIGASVYVKGYLNLYAKHLGIDASMLVERYDTQYPTTEATIRTSAGQAGLHSGRRQVKKRRSKFVSSIVAMCVAVSLGYGYYQIENKFLAGAKKNSAATNGTNASITEDENDNDGVKNTIGEANDAQKLASDVLNGNPIGNNQAIVAELELDMARSNVSERNNENSQEITGGSGNSVVSITLESSDEGSAVPVESVMPVESAGVGPAEAADTDTSVLAPVASNNKNSSELAENTNVDTNKLVSLSVQFNQECWLQIKDGRNKTIVSDTFSQNKPLSIKGLKPFSMQIGKPKSIASITVEEKQISLEKYLISGINYKYPQ